MKILVMTEEGKSEFSEILAERMKLMRGASDAQIDAWADVTAGALIAAMTEVDLEEFDNEAVDVFEHGDFLMPGAYLLARIKEGK